MCRWHVRRGPGAARTDDPLTSLRLQVRYMTSPGRGQERCPAMKSRTTGYTSVRQRRPLKMP